MKKLSRIILGWYFFLTNKNNELAQKRLKICAGCEFRKGIVCGICSCVLQAKARLPEEGCPAHRWPGEFDPVTVTYKKDVPTTLT